MSESFDWDGIPTSQLENAERSDNLIIVRSAWNNDSLYFRFDVSDTKLWAVVRENDSRDLWKDDIVEFLIDSRNDHSPGWKTDDFIYHYNVLGYTKDDRGVSDGTSDASWNSSGRYIVTTYGTVCDNSDKDEGYRVLIAIPWSEIIQKPEAGLSIGFNFGCNDNDGVPLDVKPLINWTNAEPSRSPEQFGVLKLTE